jgi:hypothetical protein
VFFFSNVNWKCVRDGESSDGKFYSADSAVAGARADACGPLTRNKAKPSSPSGMRKKCSFEVILPLARGSICTTTQETLVWEWHGCIDVYLRIAVPSVPNA